MSARMMAAQLVAPRRFEVIRTRRPDPARGQVRVEIEGCGVCASNLPAFEGRPWFSYPLSPGELGHEGWGHVEAVGKDVDPSLVGRRVALLSEHAYAEYDVAAAEDLVAIPEEGPALAPLEPFGCVFNIARRSDFQRGQRVAVIGLGFVGLGVLRLAAAAGVDVTGVSTNREALEQARQLGASETLLLESRQRTRDALIGLSQGDCFDRVVECTGHQEPLDLAGDVVCEGGRLVVAGFHQDGPRQVDMQQWNWKGIDVVNAHERDPRRIRAGMTAAADELARDPSWMASLMTDRFPLDELGGALTRAEHRPPGFVKASVLMSGGRT